MNVCFIFGSPTTKVETCSYCQSEGIQQQKKVRHIASPKNFILVLSKYVQCFTEKQHYSD